MKVKLQMLLKVHEWSVNTKYILKKLPLIWNSIPQESSSKVLIVLAITTFVCDATPIFFGKPIIALRDLFKVYGMYCIKNECYKNTKIVCASFKVSYLVHMLWTSGLPGYEASWLFWQVCTHTEFQKVVLISFEHL